MLQKYIIAAFMFFTVQMMGQGDTAFFNAIKNNDMASVSNYLQDQLDFCIFDNQEFLNKKEATAKLSQFLNNYKIQSIEILHQGASKGKNSQYKVAKLSTTKDTFRIFVYTTGELTTKSVKEIRIDKF